MICLGRWKTLLPLLGAAAVLSAIDPGEIRITSGPYWPRTKSTITVDTKLVDVGVVVRDSRGHPVAGLKREDFEINDNGKKRPVSAFAVETYTPAAAPVKPGEPAPAPTAPKPAVSKTPRYVALVFDDMALTAGDMMNSKAAAKRFVKEGFAPNDQVGVFTTTQQNNLPFTSDPAKVSAAIDKVNFRQRKIEGGMCPHYTPWDAYTIANNLDQEAFEVKIQEWMTCHNQPPPRAGRGRGSSSSSGSGGAGQDVMAEARMLWEEISMNSRNTLGSIHDLIDYMAKFDGKRVMLLASPGFLTGTLEQDEEELITQALHAGVVINSIDSRGLYTIEPLEMTGGANSRSAIHQQNVASRSQMAPSDVLGTLADGTGGTFFHNNNDLTLGFHELGMLPQVSYLLGFAPDAPDKRFHKLKVKVNAKGVDVQARPGYMSVAPADQPPPREERPIDRAMSASDAMTDAPVTFSTVTGKTDQNSPAVQIVLHVDVAKMKFREGFGLHTQKLLFIAAAYDKDGVFVSGKESEIEFALSDASYKQVHDGGINGRVTLELAPGEYRIRGVVQETIDNKISAVSLPVSVQ